ncbi:MAG: hypothetical protein U0V64_09800 [Cyclobacteriaceae bacterium]
MVLRSALFLLVILMTGCGRSGRVDVGTQEFSGDTINLSGTVRPQDNFAHFVKPIVTGAEPAAQHARRQARVVISAALDAARANKALAETTELHQAARFYGWMSDSTILQADRRWMEGQRKAILGLKNGAEVGKWLFRQAQAGGNVLVSFSTTPKQEWYLSPQQEWQAPPGREQWMLSVQQVLLESKLYEEKEVSQPAARAVDYCSALLKTFTRQPVRVAVRDLTRTMPGWDWKALTASDSVWMTDVAYFAQLSRWLTALPVNDWKAILLWSLHQDAITWLPLEPVSPVWRTKRREKAIDLLALHMPLLADKLLHSHYSRQAGDREVEEDVQLALAAQLRYTPSLSDSSKAKALAALRTLKSAGVVFQPVNTSGLVASRDTSIMTFRNELRRTRVVHPDLHSISDPLHAVIQYNPGMHTLLHTSALGALPGLAGPIEEQFGVMGSLWANALVDVIDASSVEWSAAERQRWSQRKADRNRISLLLLTDGWQRYLREHPGSNEVPRSQRMFIHWATWADRSGSTTINSLCQRNALFQRVFSVSEKDSLFSGAPAQELF